MYHAEDILWDCAGHLRQVIISHNKGGEDSAAALLKAANAVYCPDKVDCCFILRSTAGQQMHSLMICYNQVDCLSHDWGGN